MTAEPIPEVRARRGEESAHGSGARSMFERIAPTYDLLNRVMSAGIDARWRNRAVAPSPPPRETIPFGSAFSSSFSNSWRSTSVPGR